MGGRNSSFSGGWKVAGLGGWLRLMRDSGKSQALPRGSQYHELILYLSLVGYSFYWKKPIIGELTVMNRFCTWVLNLLSLINRLGWRPRSFPRSKHLSLNSRGLPELHFSYEPEERSDAVGTSPVMHGFPALSLDRKRRLGIPASNNQLAAVGQG